MGMSDVGPTAEELADDNGEDAIATGTEGAERVRDAGEIERRLRRELSKAREQARVAVAEREAAVNSLRSESNVRLVRSELQLRAIQCGIVDLDALRMLDPASVTVAPDGTVVGAEEALAAFRASKPYLFDQARSASRPMTTSAMQRPPTRAEPEPVDARVLSREQWQAERARLLSRKS